MTHPEKWAKGKGDNTRQKQPFCSTQNLGIKTATQEGCSICIILRKALHPKL
jgi:hypothetical protein